MEGLKGRTWIASIAVILMFLFVLPNFVDTSNISWWPAKKINYGLDIQGGVQLVMGADVDSVIKTTVLRQAKSLEAEFTKDGFAPKSVNTDKASTGAFEISFNNADDSKKAEALVVKNYPGSLQVMSNSDSKLEIKYFDAYLADQKQNVIRQAIETIRNRIDEFGVAEPSITQQGADRVLVQLPGMADAEQAKQLINTTAKLDFMIVNNTMSMDQVIKHIEEVEKAQNLSMKDMKYNEYISKLNEGLKGKIPEKTVVYFEKNENSKTMEAGSRPYLLQTDTDLTGEALDNASVSFDQYGSPEVALRFNTAGANKFAELTGANVNRQMAVVLDRVVKTAPNINGRIAGGQAVITLGRGMDQQNTMDEAKIIATSLRAGSLPVALEQMEERRVGPTLGKDALDKARLAAIVACAVIMLFMLIYYKGMGAVSVIGLSLNVIAVFASLGSLGATLTLPGIAGIALTVGFAVDANVLINERIKEELEAGASLMTAIQEGYRQAMSAIIDSNVTTAATAIVLLYFGTGPVRGFAVTLLAGIVATLVANVFISKVIVDNLVHRFKIKKISV